MFQNGSVENLMFRLMRTDLLEYGKDNERKVERWKNQDKGNIWYGEDKYCNKLNFDNVFVSVEYTNYIKCR